MKEKPKKITMSKKCVVCGKRAKHGVIDFVKGGKYGSLCEKHFKDFCRSVLKSA